MLNIYRGLPAEQAPAYRQLFRLLAEGELPLVFNCSGGKDRTGLAAALVLTALGTPEDVVVEDYLLPNESFGKGTPDKGYAALKISPEVVQIVGGTNADFLDAAFSAIRATSGSVSGYLRGELGITPAMLNQIHENLLEPSP
jgi:protein-tyrosine phosphatase